MRFTVVLEGEEYPVEVRNGGLRIILGDREYKASAKVSQSTLRVRIGRRNYTFTLEGRNLTLGGRTLDASFKGYFRAGLQAEGDEIAAVTRLGGEVKAPMPGRVVAVIVGEGDSVALGTPLLILEAMKMQNEIPSPVEGVVREVKVKADAVVGKEDILMVIQ